MNTRRDFLLSSAAAAAVGASLSAAETAKAASSMSPADSLKALLAGNARFVAGKPLAIPATVRREELANGQSPFAAVLGCADSRVPAELVFDHEPGDIFTVRVAGNFAAKAGIGSFEYGVAVLKTPLIIVLGHTACGAVDAACKFVKTGKPYPGNIQTLVTTLAPIAKSTQHMKGDWLRNATIANIKFTVTKLQTAQPILAEAVAKKQLEIVGALYDLHTGKVSLV